MKFFVSLSKVQDHFIILTGMLCSFILMMTDDLIHLDTWKQRRKVLVGKASLKCLSGSIYPLTKQQ